MADSDDGGTSRRDVLKKAAVGAATVGVVWSAPRVEGLSLRPNYAAASSAPIGWTAQLNALATSATIQGPEASPAVDGGVAFAQSSAFTGFGVVAAVEGTGLNQAKLTITGMNSPGGPVAFVQGNDFATNFIVSTQAGVDPAPQFPLQLSGIFTCT